ncbi:SixA phosphatase family protein [Thalassotalea euphylliae]|uniref:SixA phosphatase family protein n=1 Tax=Thalassotalea euphylliae TaxID=1655234 RepID=UPI0036385385
MKILLVALVALSLLLSNTVIAKDYTLYLVRHAEKQASEDGDPNLTACGQQRASELARILAQTNLKNVYSTSYKRTLQTANYTAQKHSVALTQYAPNGLTQLARVLKQKKETALIVGHSNTTPELLRLLTGERVTMSEDEFNLLIQVTFFEQNTVVTYLQQPLICR